MIRKIAIFLLIAVIFGTAGVGVFLYKQKQEQEFLRAHNNLAQQELEKENYEKAIEHLTIVVDAGQKYEQPEQALYQLALAYEKSSPKDAYGYWEQFVKQFPDSTHASEAKLNMAEDLLSVNVEQARDIYKGLSSSSDPLVQGKALAGIGKTYEMENKSGEALRIYNEILETSTNPTAIAAAKDFISVINTQKLWSPPLDEFCELYEVQRGDSPVRIGQKYKTTGWFIEEANNLQAQLRPGMRLKVPKEPFRIIVDKSNCRLNLLTESGKFVKWYPCGIGEIDYKTPVGEFTIYEKIVDPNWYKPGGGLVKAGDPENALGTRWMEFGKSLGIHGTNAPETIGFRKSAGCIRMHNEDVEELYKIVTYGTKVAIVENELDYNPQPQPAAETVEEATGTETESAS